MKRIFGNIVGWIIIVLLLLWALRVNAGPLISGGGGSSGSGSGTVSSGTAGRVSYYTGSTTVDDASGVTTTDGTDLFVNGVEFDCTSSPQTQIDSKESSDSNNFDPDRLNGDSDDDNLVDVNILELFEDQSGVTVDSGTTTITPVGHNIEYIFVTAEDADLNIQLAETNASNGDVVGIFNSGTTKFGLIDQSGRQHLGGTARLSEEDFIYFRYCTDRYQCIGMSVSEWLIGSLEVPNSDNPTTDAEGEITQDNDDAALEVYGIDISGVTNSVLLPFLHSETFVFPTPNTMQAETADWPFKHFDTETYPHGVTITDIEINTSTAITNDTFTIEEWSNYGGTSQGTVEAMDLSGVTTLAVVYGDIDDANIAADAWLNVILGDDDVSRMAITIRYLVKEGD